MISTTRVRHHGEIVYWNTPRGWGFVRRDDGRPDVFLHVKNMPAGHVITKGQRIAFAIGMNPRFDKAEARDISILEEATSQGDLT
jgi:cold shock CspA family protein